MASESLSLGKWAAGIAATVIAALLIWWLTRPGGVLDPVPDFSGDWLTPNRGLSYKVIQNDNQYTWVIRENGVSGTGTVEGETLVLQLEGERVVYQAKMDSRGNPIVLHTFHPHYAGVVLFKSCHEFEIFLNDLAVDYPELKNQIYQFIKNLPNPACPNAIE